MRALGRVICLLVSVGAVSNSTSGVRLQADHGRPKPLATGLNPLLMSASAQDTGRRWPTESPPRPLAARQVNFPPYEIRTLENGLQVVAVLHHEQPVVSMRMIVRAGAALDPKGKAGLANLAASLLDQGTTTKSAGEMNDAIDFMGGVMGAGAGTDLTFVNVIVMKDSFETGMRMLSEMARQPAFAIEEIERQRQQALSNLQVSFEDPEFLANAVFDRLVYGFHPYGMLQSGTPASLSAISRQDLLTYHQQHFVPNNAILAIVGDVSAAEAFDGVQKVFGDWQRRDVPRPAFTSPPEPTRRVVVVNKPDAVQTEVRVGHLGVRRNSPDYMALNLALRILGGEGANRLHQLLRTERGLTYGAKADMGTYLETGDFEASTNTRSEATGEVLRLIVDEFWRLQRERVSERELADAKAYLTGSFPLTIETPDAIATQVLNVLFYGLPVEQLESFRERVNAVRTDDIERVARYFLRPDRLSIVLVGNAAAFSSQLRGVGFSNFELVEMSELDLNAVDFKRAGKAADAGSADPTGRAAAARTAGGAGMSRETGAKRRPAGLALPGRVAYQRTDTQSVRPKIAPEEGAAARALLDKVIAAKGGLERLRSIKSITATTRADSTGPDGQTSSAETITYLEYPNRVRVETKTGDVALVQVYDGTRAWVKDPNGIHDVPERVIRDFEAGLRRDTIAVLLASVDGRVRARALPDVKDDAGKLHHAIELSGTDLDPMVMYVDPETNLIAKQTYVAGGLGQPLVEEVFSDYKVVDAVQVAFTAKLRVGGKQVLERRVAEFAINAPLGPALFTRPTS
jgi:zinc protease